VVIKLEKEKLWTELEFIYWNWIKKSCSLPIWVDGGGDLAK